MTTTCTESDDNRIQMSHTTKPHIRLDPSPTRERKHKRDRLVLATQDINPVRSLKRAAPHQNSPKNTKLKEARNYEIQSTRTTRAESSEDKGGE
jgi:hypothetical protein